MICVARDAMLCQTQVKRMSSTSRRTRPPLDKLWVGLCLVVKGATSRLGHPLKVDWLHLQWIMDQVWRVVEEKWRLHIHDMAFIISATVRRCGAVIHEKQKMSLYAMAHASFRTCSPRLGRAGKQCEGIVFENTLPHSCHRNLYCPALIGRRNYSRWNGRHPPAHFARVNTCMHTRGRAVRLICVARVRTPTCASQRSTPTGQVLSPVCCSQYELPWSGRL